MKIEVPEQLTEVIKAGVKANRAVEGSIALGGTICSLFAHHRESSDIDFVLSDLRERFSKIRDDLLDLPEWKEARVRIPVLILGSLDGFEIGYRQMLRTVPIETQIIDTPEGELVVPTVPELIRTKAFLTYNRNYTRDFFDFAELSCLYEIEEVVNILRNLDEIFSWEKQPTIVIEVIKNLLSPEPHDLYHEKHGFDQLRFLEPKLKNWEQVEQRCRDIGQALAIRILT